MVADSATRFECSAISDGRLDSGLGALQSLLKKGSNVGCVQGLMWEHG